MWSLLYSAEFSGLDYMRSLAIDSMILNPEWPGDARVFPKLNGLDPDLAYATSCSYMLLQGMFGWLLSNNSRILSVDDRLEILRDNIDGRNVGEHHLCNLVVPFQLDQMPLHSICENGSLDNVQRMEAQTSTLQPSYTHVMDLQVLIDIVCEKEWDSALWAVIALRRVLLRDQQHLVCALTGRLW